VYAEGAKAEGEFTCDQLKYVKQKVCEKGFRVTDPDGTEHWGWKLKSEHTPGGANGEDGDSD
jgi:hypothetical protein